MSTFSGFYVIAFALYLIAYSFTSLSRSPVKINIFVYYSLFSEQNFLIFFINVNPFIIGISKSVITKSIF